AEAVVAAAVGGDLVDELEDAVLARPRVGQAVDDQDVVTGVGRGLDGLEVPLGREAGELQRVGLDPVCVAAGAALLSAHPGDSLAIVSAVNVLPLPLGPIRARRSLRCSLRAGWKRLMVVSLEGQSQLG